MGNVSQPKSFYIDQRIFRFAGWQLILAGCAFGIDQYLQTGWITLLVLPVLGAIIVSAGIRWKTMALIIPGALVMGVGAAIAVLLARGIALPMEARAGYAIMACGLSWFVIFFASIAIRARRADWAMVPGAVLAASGYPLTQTPFDFWLLIFLTLTSLGAVFILWGVMARLFGLIIPGCILIGIGPGIYFGWAGIKEPTGLTETGVMLVWFALGWGLITIFSRVLTARFVWWPLIPGGLLAVVGWGLYIGGDPGNALAFIGNTGSISLVIFGIYLLLLRRGFKE